MTNPLPPTTSVVEGNNYLCRVFSAGWRWIFYLNIPFGVVALIASFFLIPNLRETDRRPVDMLGVLLCGTGTFALLVGLERIAARFDALSIGLLLRGIVLMAAAIRQFRHSAADDRPGGLRHPNLSCRRSGCGRTNI